LYAVDVMRQRMMQVRLAKMTVATVELNVRATKSA
jgi:hypothetical protein